jgi:hypothetical protein
MEYMHFYPVDGERRFVRNVPNHLTHYKNGNLEGRNVSFHSDERPQLSRVASI